MPAYDMECNECQLQYEVVAGPDDKEGICPLCDATARRIYLTIGSIRTSDDGGNHYKEILEIVDKDGGQHCQDFLKNPNRGTYEAWTKGAGVRPLERGEELITPKKQRDRTKAKMVKHRAKVKKNLMKRRSITLGGQL